MRQVQFGMIIIPRNISKEICQTPLHKKIYKTLLREIKEDLNDRRQNISKRLGQEGYIKLVD